MRIFLVGYMGCGKSTLGRQLAPALGISWIDLDAEFESRYKISISHFFNKYGEVAFRKLEHKLLTEISEIPDIVVSTGGGTPCYHDNMQLMNHNGLTMYLVAEPDLLLSRIALAPSKRPLFQQMKGADSLLHIRQHLESRELHYKLAKITIDATKPDLDEVKNLIQNYLDDSQITR
ncbi:MAG: shikimate kinase [Bacteroidota bacterium]